MMEGSVNALAATGITTEIIDDLTHTSYRWGHRSPHERQPSMVPTVYDTTKSHMIT